MRRCAAIAVLSAAVTQACAGEASDTDVLAIVQQHCVPCHAQNPTHEAFAKPPRNVVLETIEQIKAHAEKVQEQVVETRSMPLGNETGMTDAERDAIALWIAALNKTVKTPRD